MFVGHLAVAFAAKRAAPRVPLPWLVAGGLFVDLVWPLLLLAGVETARIAPGATAFNALVFESYPWTHSLAMGVAWGVVLAGVARGFGVAREGLPVLMLTVPSHWVLDWVTHVPDLPLLPGSTAMHGLGLWNSVAGTLAVEGALWALALGLYLQGRRPQGGKGVAALASFVVVTTLLWAGSAFGPPPPDVTALAVSALALWLLLPWAWWVERTSSERRRVG